jgi:glycosyltransferase involved in cell wall biosynthesis
MPYRQNGASQDRRGALVPDASIVITTYRRTAMLAELLGALRPQLRDHAVEVIVVDNCPDASAKEVVRGEGDAALRYVHEKRSGVVHARNTGVAAASGAYVIFLDDDEVPCIGWLDAWMSQADGRTDMSFGRIAPRLLAPCPAGLIDQVTRNFSRDMRKATGEDISHLWAYLGTGNAMFHKARCLNQPTPFDLRFNSRGGEDVWLIRRLVLEGRRLIWNNEAMVEELVPDDRMSLRSLRIRRFNQGQLRCILMYGPGGLGGLVRVLPWMLVGAVQFAIFRTAAFLASGMVSSRAPDLMCRASGGAGKLMWWRKAVMRSYGNGS